jgi:hypothetical protein
MITDVAKADWNSSSSFIPALKNQTAEMLTVLRGMSQTDQWLGLKREMHRAVAALLHGRAVVYWLVDHTPAGGRHSILAFHEPRQNEAVIEIPEEPVIEPCAPRVVRGGRFPTVLHAIEAIVLGVKIAQGCGLRLCKDSVPKTVLKYPSLGFLHRDAFAIRLGVYVSEATIVQIPLTIDPPHTNAIIFRKQARGSYLDARTIALAHYIIMQHDAWLTEHLLRHTMLIYPKDASIGSANNRMITFETLHHAEICERYNLFFPDRLRPLVEGHPCSALSLTNKLMSTVEQGRTIWHLYL